MRLLVLTYAYPPVYSACSARWGRITEHWAAAGVEVDVITAWQPGLPRTAVHRGVRLLRSGGTLVQDARCRARRIVDDAAPGAAAGWSMKRSVVRAFRVSVWRNVYWPDHAALWMMRALVAVHRQMRRAQYDGIVSVAFPFTDHVVAYLATALRARRRGRRPIWIADYGDPFSFLKDTPPNNRQLYSRLNRWADMKVIEAADAVVMPNEEMKQLYSDICAQASDKIEIVPHIADGALIRPGSFKSAAVKRGGTVRLLYAGAFAAGVRTPDHMLKVMTVAVRQLEQRGYNVRLVIAGDVNNCSAAFDDFANGEVGHTLVMYGVVAPEAAATLVSEADILVNVGNTTPYRQPSKLVEYMATGKPIVNFATSRCDSSVGMLSHYASAFHSVCGEPIERQAAGVVEFVVAPPPLDADRVRQKLARHTTASVSAQYLSMVSKLSGTVAVVDSE
jgi:glycosyltransferase involved in cell wall biosynthesis